MLEFSKSVFICTRSHVSYFAVYLGQVVVHYDFAFCFCICICFGAIYRIFYSSIKRARHNHYPNGKEKKIHFYRCSYTDVKLSKLGSFVSPF